MEQDNGNFKISRSNNNNNNNNDTMRRNNNLKRRKFYTDNIKKMIDETMAYDSHKKNHERYIEQIQSKEADQLNRTILVTNVKDLNRPKNLRHLKTFLERNYGPLESCTIVTTSTIRRNNDNDNYFPNAKVTFQYQKDSFKLYNKSLLEVRKQKKTKQKIHAPSCGHNRFIYVQPGLPQRAQIHVSSDKSYVSFDTNSISMGHFDSRSTEENSFFIPPSSNNHTNNYHSSSVEFLEEYEGFRNTMVTLDLEKRSIRISKEITGYYRKFGNFIVSSRGSDDDVEETLTFSLKGLHGGLELCKDVHYGTFSLIFLAKYPPKLVEKQILMSNMTRQVKRLIAITDEIDAPFGHCLAYRLNISRSVVESLFSNIDFFQKLRDFGMIHTHDILCFNNIKNIQTKFIHYNDSKYQFEKKLRFIHCEKISE